MSEQALDIPSPPALRVSEADRLLLHNLILQQQLWRARLDLITLQFLQTSEPRVVQQRIEELTARVSDATNKLFSEYQVDSRAHQLDVEQGTFVPRNS